VNTIKREVDFMEKIAKILAHPLVAFGLGYVISTIQYFALFGK
jgi:hypothetical protein